MIPRRCGRVISGRGGVTGPVTWRRKLLLQQGDLYRGPLFLIEGTVKLYRTARTGRPFVLHLKRPGEAFAEAPLFEQPAGRYYPVTAEAVTACRLLLLPTDPFLAFLEAHPRLYRALLVSLASCLRAVTDQLELISLYSVRSRLARYLLHQAVPSDDLRQPVVELDVPKATLAAHLGTIPETLSRSLHDLARRSMIRLEGSTIYLKDLEQLRLLAQGQAVIRADAG